MLCLCWHSDQVFSLSCVSHYYGNLYFLSPRKPKRWMYFVLCRSLKIFVCSYLLISYQALNQKKENSKHWDVYAISPRIITHFTWISVIDGPVSPSLQCHLHKVFRRNYGSWLCLDSVLAMMIHDEAQQSQCQHPQITSWPVSLFAHFATCYSLTYTVIPELDAANQPTNQTNQPTENPKPKPPMDSQVQALQLEAVSW